MQTNRGTVLKLTAGALTFAFGLTACQSQQQPIAKLDSAASMASKDAQPEVLLANKSAAALAAGNVVAAVSFAELAVTAEPQNAEARVALAKAYFAAGRFHSASDAYGDIIAMNPSDDGARFRLALADLATGDRQAALATLDRLTSPSLVADVGLAFALAGEADRGVTLLSNAVRGGDTSPRVRQNLALAQALAGDWAAATTTASIDLAPDAVNARVAEWAHIASNKDAAWRVSTVLGVNAATDSGRPAQLAWAAPVQPEVQVAAALPADPVPVAEPVQTLAQPVVEVAKAEPVEPVPVKVAAVEVPAPKPVVFEGNKTAPQKPATLVKASAPVPSLSAKPVSAVKRQIRALPKPTNGAWVVQLGAYAKSEFVNVGWQGLVKKNKALSDYKPLKSSIEVKGSTFHRLAVGSFADVDDAIDLCTGLKAEGYSCFVRKGEGVQPAKPVKKA